MSYCRFLEGDVYMFMSVEGRIECMCCSLKGEEDPPSTFYSRREAIKHLEAHKAKGDEVPTHAFQRLRRELLEDGDLIK